MPTTCPQGGDNLVYNLYFMISSVAVLTVDTQVSPPNLSFIYFRSSEKANTEVVMVSGQADRTMRWRIWISVAQEGYQQSEECPSRYAIG